jgi:hypothetical protein
MGLSIHLGVTNVAGRFSGRGRTVLSHPSSLESKLRWWWLQRLAAQNAAHLWGRARELKPCSQTTASGIAYQALVVDVSQLVTNATWFNGSLPPTLEHISALVNSVHVAFA